MLVYSCLSVTGFARSLGAVAARASRRPGSAIISRPRPHRRWRRALRLRSAECARRAERRAVRAGPVFRNLRWPPRTQHRQERQQTHRAHNCLHFPRQQRAALGFLPSPRGATHAGRGAVAGVAMEGEEEPGEHHFEEEPDAGDEALPDEEAAAPGSEKKRDTKSLVQRLALAEFFASALSLRRLHGHPLYRAGICAPSELIAAPMLHLQGHNIQAPKRGWLSRPRSGFRTNRRATYSCPPRGPPARPAAC